MHTAKDAIFGNVNKLCAFFLLGQLAGQVGFAQQKIEPDATKGNIGGRTAISVFPGRQDGDRLEVLFPLEFQAHLTKHDDPGSDSVYPCGEWFQPERGRYRVWIEGGWLISPFSRLVGYAGGPFRGRGLVSILPVVEAGRVMLPQRIERTENLVLRLLHSGPFSEGEFPRWEISRRAPTSKIRDGLLMPAGQVIGGLWDERRQSYVEISRPFEVKARSTVEIPLFEAPKSGAILVVQARRHALASTTREAPIFFSLVQGAGSTAPDLVIEAADRVYAVWYALTPGPAELRGGSWSSLLASRSLILEGGRILRIVDALEPLQQK